MEAPEAIMLRRNARELVLDAAEDDGVLDCTTLEFASGGVTDELLATAHEADVELLVDPESQFADLITAYEQIYEQNGKPSMDHTYTLVD